MRELFVFVLRHSSIVSIAVCAGEDGDHSGNIGKSRGELSNDDEKFRPSVVV